MACASWHSRASWLGSALPRRCSETGFGLEEDRGLPGLFALRGSRPAPAEAVVVRFDRDALARLRDAPADPADGRSRCAAALRAMAGYRACEASPASSGCRAWCQACLVEELTRRGAAVIAFDISFRRTRAARPACRPSRRRSGAHGAVILLERAVREWPRPAGGKAGDTVQTDVVERPHAALAEAAIATAPLLLPRGSVQVHQFWAFNPALPASQLPARALEVLALPALGRLAATTGEPLRRAGTPAELLARRTGWFRAQAAAADGGISACRACRPEHRRTAEPWRRCSAPIAAPTPTISTSTARRAPSRRCPRPTS